MNIQSEVRNGIGSLSLKDKYDVAVCGAGPAGITAALAAARSGAKTLLIERNGFPGGVITASCCPALMGAMACDRKIVGGIPDEFVRRLDRHGWARIIDMESGCPRTDPIGDALLDGTVAVSEHGVIVIANRMLREAGVDCLYNAQLIGADTNKRQLRSLELNLLEGPVRIEADYYVDATGNADLVYRAGGKCVEAADEYAMTKTILVRIGGVRNFNKKDISRRFKEFSDAGDKPFPNQDRFMGTHTLNPGEVLLNMTLACGSGLTSASVTELDYTLREQIDRGLSWFRKHFKEFAGCFLVSSAFQVGLRAGRSMVGLDTLTASYIDENRQTDEPVALGTRNYGGHGLRGFNSEWDKDHQGVYAIPLKCLISESFDNVCAAGRCISAEAKILSSFRFTMRCAALGQASGTLCALAAKKSSSLQQVPYAILKENLLEGGAILSFKGA